MYRIDRNDYFGNQKKATVFTPKDLSNFLFDILNKNVEKNSYIFDPCVGQGSLLNPWQLNNYKVKGVDIEDQGFEGTIVKNYLEITMKDLNNKIPSLVIMNPPFNLDLKTQDYIKNNSKKYGSSRPFLPEVWLKKAIELFGKDIPIVMFTPYGFRLNVAKSSKRREKLKNNEYPEISSIISLPRDIYEGVSFHSEILVFNIKGLKPHYIY